jgi:cyclase
MHRSLIIARIRPGKESAVRQVFAESDATSLPRDVGVVHRSLYTLGDLYVHLVDVRGDARESLERARGLPAFRQISEDLKPYISAYDPSTWRSPHDAVAQQFYHWDAEG